MEAPFETPQNKESGHESIWFKFSSNVVKHIKEYVLPQYGDYGSDPAAEYTVDDCIKQAQRYLARWGRQSRTGEEERDLMKAAHWLGIAFMKITIEKVLKQAVDKDHSGK